MQILKYDIAHEKEVFLNGIHECDVCCMEYNGSDMLRLEQCLHHFCRPCLSHFVTSTLQDGSILSLKCLQTSCDAFLTANEIRSLVSEDLYRKWEEISVQKALEGMQDVIWCPKCLLPAVQDSPEDTVAVCGNCNFAFCTRCRDGFHPGFDCETIEQELGKLEKATASSSGANKKQNERERARKMQLLKFEALNQHFLRKQAKPCPWCGIHVQKIDGCNKVVCTSCRNILCWVCGRQISGYDHFSSTRCNLSGEERDLPLWDQPQQPTIERIEMDNRLREDPKLSRELRKCPQCKQNNLRKDRNNHVRCWACQCHFCCVCHMRIMDKPLSAHFNKVASKCTQHSD